jgi:hypothetical protein
VLSLKADFKPDNIMVHRYRLAEIRRIVGILEVARRLAMLGLKENCGRSHKR